MHAHYQVVRYRLQALKVKDNNPDDYEGRMARAYFPSLLTLFHLRDATDVKGDSVVNFKGLTSWKHLSS